MAALAGLAINPTAKTAARQNRISMKVRGFRTAVRWLAPRKAHGCIDDADGAADNFADALNLTVIPVFIDSAKTAKGVHSIQIARRPAESPPIPQNK
ncbi:MAG: hypothetical protein JHC87_07635 [Thermoleophilaceae bacterium]|nr:hypothetical protein [Thermoleophilaceae bacterium]